MLDFFIGTFLLGVLYVAFSIFMGWCYSEMEYSKKTPYLFEFLTAPIILIIGVLILLAIIFAWSIIVKVGIFNV